MPLAPALVLLCASALAQVPVPRAPQALAQVEPPKAYFVDASTPGVVLGARVQSFERADGKPMTAEDMARAQLILDKLFDGVAGAPKERLGEALTVDARVRGDRLHSLTLTNPASGWSAEVGQLGLGVNSPQMSPSWYGNLQGNWDSKPSSWVDYRIKLQTGYVELRSRMFPEGPDPRPARVLSLARSLGLPEDRAAELGRYVTYDDETKTQGILVSSLLVELGRAYHLGGPVDLTWAMGSLTKVLWFAPNQSFDETIGLRVRLLKDLSVGVFGGASQNLSPVGNRLFQEALDKGTLDAKLYLENSPHAAVGVWGKVPGVQDLRFSATAARRWNDNTTADKAELSVTTKLLDRPLHLRGSVQDERGTNIEFHRRTARAELAYELTERASAYLAYEKEKFRYGNAEVNSDAVMLGLEVKIGKQSSLSYEQLFGSQGLSKAGDEKFRRLLDDVNRGLVLGASAVDAAAAVHEGFSLTLTPAQMERLLNELSLSLSRFDPFQSESLVRQLRERGLTEEQLAFLRDSWLRTVSPSSPYYDDIRKLFPDLKIDLDLKDAAAYWRAHRGEILELAGLLAQEEVWNAALVNAARGELLRVIADEGRIDVPIGGSELHLKLGAPSILAAANVLNSRLSPTAPLAQGELDSRLLREAGHQLGLTGDQITERMIADRVFQLAEERFRAELERRLTDAIARTVGAGTQEFTQNLLANLPPEVAAELRRRYGEDLSGLIDSHMTAEQIKRILLERVPPDLAAWLAQRYGADVAQGLATMTGWAAEIIRREINMLMIRLILASEELNRLTVDRGRKIDDLNLRFAMRSFQMLDERRRTKVEDRIKDIQLKAAAQAERDERAFVDRLTLQGKAQLAALHQAQGWPKGLVIEVADEDVAPLFAYYGDVALFQMFAQMAEAYKKLEKKELALAFDFIEPGTPSIAMNGTAIRVAPGGARIGFELGKPKDARDASLRLSYLPNYVK